MSNTQANLSDSDTYIEEKATNGEKTPLLAVENLKKYFPVKHGFLQQIFSTKKQLVYAIDNISFNIYQGEIFCLVGESGCGKTTTARVLAGLEDPTSGKFSWNGEEISAEELKPHKGNVKSQIVFQNPFSALNPRMKLGNAALHPLVIHDEIVDINTKRKMRRSLFGEYFLLLGIFLSFLVLTNALISTEHVTTIYSKKITKTSIGLSIFAIGFLIYLFLTWYQCNQIQDNTITGLFKEIGLTPPLQYYEKYPHEVSGGERQRACIARGIVLNPTLLIADEPTSMLDVSLRAGILDLLKSLQEKYDVAILFITHDLATARHFGDRVGVMYVGKLIEKGEIDDIFKQPLHPYTNALIDAIPTPVPGEKTYKLPKGDVADAINPPSGCRFHPRCDYAKLELCAKEEPELREIRPNHWVACHYPLYEK